MNAVPGFMQYISLMADLATRYQRNQMLGQMLGQQQIWTQVENFSRQVQASLDPVEVAFQVANDGRRLVNCDRLSVGIRYAGKPIIEAISGADVIERRSNLVRLMQKLAVRVVEWGEKLVFTGNKDESLPPKILEALDAYLAESGSKLLVALPLKDDRDKDKKKPYRSILIMESFDPPADPQQMIARLDVVGRHSCPALYNSIQHKRIPMRFLWMPIAKLQEGLGGAAKAIAVAVAFGIVLLLALLWFVPYPLKMDSVGHLQPEIKRKLYSPVEGIVKELAVQPGELVSENRSLGVMHDAQLEKEIRTYRKDIQYANRDSLMWEQRSNKGNETERLSSLVEAEKAKILRQSKEKELESLIKRANADSQPNREGFFFLKAPNFTAQENLKVGKKEWMVLSTAFQESLTNRAVKPSEELLRLGAVDGPWELELKIPQEHIGQVLRGFERLKTDELDVIFIVRSDPTRKFMGKLPRSKVGGEATPEKTDGMEAAPVVTASVRLNGNGIPVEYVLPKELLLTGTDVHAKILCGNERMGYSLFYGLWEFFYEKVVFFF